MEYLFHCTPLPSSPSPPPNNPGKASHIMVSHGSISQACWRTSSVTQTKECSHLVRVASRLVLNIKEHQIFLPLNVISGSSPSGCPSLGLICRYIVCGESLLLPDYVQLLKPEFADYKLPHIWWIPYIIIWLVLYFRYPSKASSHTDSLGGRSQRTKPAILCVHLIAREKNLLKRNGQHRLLAAFARNDKDCNFLVKLHVSSKSAGLSTKDLIWS